MYPLLFMPFSSDSKEYLEDLPVSYDLKCSETFGEGAMNVTISEARRIGGEPVYSVAITSVKVVLTLIIISATDFPLFEHFDVGAVAGDVWPDSGGERGGGGDSRPDHQGLDHQEAHEGGGESGGDSHQTRQK